MCEQCVEAVEQHFPGISDLDRRDLLWGATAFPFCDPGTVERQLAEHVSAGATTVDEACARADMETEAAMEEMHLRSQFMGWGWQPGGNVA